MGRALPLPPEGVTRTVFLEYHARLRQKTTTSPDVLAKYKLLAKQFAQLRQPTLPLPVPEASASASYHKTRSLGGAKAEWQESGPEILAGSPYGASTEFQDKLSEEELDQLMGQLRQGRTVLDHLKEEGQMLLRTIDLISRRPRPGKARGALIREPGYKTRTITAHEATETVAGQYLRRLFFSVLVHWKPTQSVMKGNKLKAIRRCVKGKVKGKIIYSSDLTAATDFAHQDVAITVLSTILDTWGLDPRYQQVVAQVLGPHELTLMVPGKASVKKLTFVNYTGILMGTPLSWVALNLVNFFTYAIAWGEHHSTPIERVLSGATPTASVCGDDLIAYTEDAVADKYEERLKDVGLRPNIPKSFRSYTGGVFTEVSFTIRRGHLTVGEPFPILGRAARPNRVPIVHSVDPIGDIPLKLFTNELDWSALGPSLTAALGYVPRAVRFDVLQGAKRITGMAIPDLIPRLAKAGIDPGASRSLGGAEIPWMKSRFSSTKRAASAAAAPQTLERFYLSGDGDKVLRGLLATAYAVVTYQEGAELALMLGLGDYPLGHSGYTEEKRPAGYPRIPTVIASAGSWVDGVQGAAAAHLDVLRSSGVVPRVIPRSQQSLSIGKVGSVVKQARSMLIETYPTAQPSAHPEASYQKYNKAVSLLVSGPPDESQSHELVKVKPGWGQRKTIRVPSFPDTPLNRRLLYRYIGISRPVKGSLPTIARGSALRTEGLVHSRPSGEA
jgi:hypothetical protein